MSTWLDFDSPRRLSHTPVCLFPKTDRVEALPWPWVPSSHGPGAQAEWKEKEKKVSWGQALLFQISDSQGGELPGSSVRALPAWLRPSRSGGAWNESWRNDRPKFSFLLFVTENNLTNTSTDGQHCSCHCGRHNATTIKNVNELCYQGVLILGIYAKDSLHDSKVLYVEKLISTLDFSLGATNQLLHQET